MIKVRVVEFWIDFLKKIFFFVKFFKGVQIKIDSRDIELKERTNKFFSPKYSGPKITH